MGQWRQLAGLAGLLALAGCSTPFTAAPDETVVKNFAGGVAGDEPRAVLEARGILDAGGSAADAATAMYFALAATLPSSASLGSGGVCLVYDAASTTVEALDFIGGAPGTIPSGADRPSAVPGSPLGFWLLHARYGRLPWSQLISPGERLARFGVSASRTLINEMAPVAAPLLQDVAARRIFADPSGRPISESETFVQPDLARTLETIRLSGAIELYRGELARELADGAAAAGGSLSLQDLAAFKPEWRPTVKVPYGPRTAHFAPPPAAAGVVAAQMFAMLDARDRFDDANEAGRMHVLAETAMRAFADRGRWLKSDYTAIEPSRNLVASAHLDRLMKGFDGQRHTAAGALETAPVMRPENPAATSFIAVDRTGSAVSCAITMNNNFGTGRIAGDTGIVLAAVPSPLGRGPLSLGPMLAINDFTKQLHFAGAATGGVAAPTALVNVAARAVLSQQPLPEAMQARRVHHGGAPDTTYYEPGVSEDIVAALAQRGHRVAATPILGLVNAIACQQGMPREPNGCALLADPRGHGLAAIVSD